MPLRMVQTKARDQLREYFERPGSLSQTKLADRLGIKQPSVSAWVAGESRPESHLREALEFVVGIPARDWMTDPELDAIERARLDSERPSKTGTED